MRNMNLRLWTGLVLSSLLLLFSPSVIAQGSQTPPPFVIACLETANAMSGYAVMRKAGITKEEAVATFTISLKLGQYLSSREGQGPIPPKIIKAQRAGLDAIYDLPEQAMELDEALDLWIRLSTQKCMKDNSPDSPDRMIPS